MMKTLKRYFLKTYKNIFNTMKAINEYVSNDTISSIDEYLLSKSNPKTSNNVSGMIDKGIDHDECYNMTSFWNGCLKSTRSDLEKMLWKASRGYDKVQWIWFCRIDNIPFTIYDYREPKYNKDTEIEYHIGTAVKEDTLEIVDKLKALGFNAYMS